MTYSHGRLPFVAAMLLVVPALTFVVTSVLQYELGLGSAADALQPVFNPSNDLVRRAVDVLIVFGPVATFVVALTQIVHIRLAREAGAVVCTMRVTWNSGFFMLGIVSAIVVGVLGLYLVVENLPCLVGLQTNC